GRHDLDLHDRLEEDRVGERGGLLEGEGARDLEGDVARVDGVIRAVVALGLEVDDGETGEDPAPGRLLDPLVDGGDELAGDDAAHDRVDEVVPLASAPRAEADPAVAELASSARLL